VEQRKIMTMADANNLLLDGAEALALAEQTGICLDMEHLRRTRKRISSRIEQVEKYFLDSTPLGMAWVTAFPDKRRNTQSNPQLVKVLKKLGVSGDKLTAKGQVSVKNEVLKEMKVEGVEDLILLRKLRKAHSTYLGGLEREAVQHADGLWYLHPFFHLNTVRTYRSSSSNPNFQNIPTRDPEFKRYIRPAIIPRPGRALMEVDFKALEVGIAACYHKDPTMLEYLRTDPGAMHSDMARELFLMAPGEAVSKQVRHAAKNGFVFPEFYGDWYRDCAQGMWALRDTLDVNGLTLEERLAGKGIGSYEAFEKLVEKAERRMWDERFPVYRDWKKRWWKDYLRKGYFDTLTGFRCSGEMEQNQAINYPVQGAAFHCLLKVLTWAVREMREGWPDVLLVGQIHDSALFDLPEDQCVGWFDVLRKLVQERLPREWTWIIVPLDLEVERSKPNSSWYEMGDLHDPLQQTQTPEPGSHQWKLGHRGVYPSTPDGE